METRKLGSSGISIAPLVFGGNVLGWTADEPTSFKLLDAFVDAGLNCIDTADVYSRWAPGHVGGESETVIGNWLQRNPAKRDRVVIATKVGMDMGPGGKGLSRAHILRSVEGSLKRLRTDVIDLYQSHADDAETPFEETLRAYEELIRAGKVRAIGASNYSAPRLVEALKVAADRKLPAYCSLQPEYNLYDREGFERELAGVCREHGLGVITYFSLASGFLTGKYRSKTDLGKSVRGDRVARFLDDRGLRILKALDDAAERHRATPARVALAWLMARPGITAPIASATSLEQLRELIEATRLRLDADTIRALDEASAPGANRG